jgi:hypothetical protein
MNFFAAIPFLFLEALPVLPETFCAPEMLTIGDAWRAVEAERLRVPVLLECSEFLECPKRLAAILAHLRFIQKRGGALEGSARKRLEAAVEIVAMERDAALEAALKGDGALLRECWEEVTPHLHALEAGLSGALGGGGGRPPFAGGASAGGLGIRLTNISVLERGVPAEYGFKLISGRGERLKQNALVEEGGTRLHVVVVNQSLSDFHHEFPSPGKAEGEWNFRFTPKTEEPYRAWIHATPKANQREEWALTNLTQTGIPFVFPVSEKVESLEDAAPGVLARLQFPATRPTAGVPARLRLVLEAPAPLPAAGSGPVSIKHVTAVCEDLRTIVHLHPVERTEPLGPRGGSADFYFEVPIPGFYRIFIEAAWGGKTALVRFGMEMKADAFPLK